MTSSVTIEEAQAGLRALIARLAPGAELEITENSRPVARLVAMASAPRKPRHPGSARGKLVILKEDDEHLNNFADYLN